MDRTEEMNKLVDDLSKKLFNMTITEAIDQDLCIVCKSHAFHRIYSVAGMKEYKKSGLCEDCFDEMTE